MTLLKHKNTAQDSRRGEKGNVMFLIFLGVVMFAALSFNVAQMLRSGDSTVAITKQKARLYSSEILDYGRAIKQALQNVKISNECMDSDISFENSVISGYTHSPIARDECKIFHNDGGGMTYLPPSSDWMDPNFSTQPHYSEWYFPSDISHLDVPSGAGISGFELSVFLPYIRKSVCDQLNERIGVTNVGEPAPTDAADSYYDNNKYKGVFDTSAADSSIDLPGVYIGCYQANSAAASNSAEANSYVFFQVLVQNN